MSRAKTLKLLEQKAYDPETIGNDFEYVSNKLNITTEELKSYFYDSNKTFRITEINIGFTISVKNKSTFGLEKGGKR